VPRDSPSHADFSIGTNDVLQYLFASDRLNGAVADLGDVLEPAVLSLSRHVVDAGHENGSWVGVCGEAAGDPTVTAALIGLGIDELSMTKVAIPSACHSGRVPRRGRRSHGQARMMRPMHGRSSRRGSARAS